jgi:WD40 repeat protein
MPAQRRPIVSLLTAVVSATLLARGATAADSYARIEAGGHIGAVRQVLLTEDAQRLVSVGDDKVIRLWSTDTGRALKTIRGPIGEGRLGAIYAAAIQGSRLAVGGYSAVPVARTAGDTIVQQGGEAGEVRIFDLASSRFVRSLPVAGQAAVFRLAYAPDGARLAAAAGSIVTILAPDEGKTLRTLPAPGKGAIVGLAFSPDGSRIATAQTDGTVTLFDANSGRRFPVKGAASGLQCLDWSMQGTLAVGGQDGRILLWPKPDTAAAPQALKQDDGVTCLAFAPDGSRLISGSGQTPGRRDRVARVWSLPEGRPERRFELHNATLFCVSARENLVASADAAGVIQLWNPETGALRRTLTGAGAATLSVGWSPDSKRVAWGTSEEGTLSQAFDFTENRPGLPDGTAWVRAQTTQAGQVLQIADDGSAIVLRGTDGKERRLRDTAGWEPGERVVLGAWAGAGKVVIATNNTLGLYTIGSKGLERQALYIGHDGIVTAVSVAPSGAYLASASADQTIRVWNLSEIGKEVGRQKRAVLPLVSLFETRDGDWVAWNERKGYYAASAGGESYYGFHRNRGAGQTGEFIRAQQLRAEQGTYYRPDILCRLLEAGTVEGAVQRAQAAGYRPDIPQPMAARAAQVPQLELVAVEDAVAEGDRYNARKPVVRIRIRVVAADASSCQVQVQVNRPIVSKRLVEIGGTGPERWVETTPLRPGENRVCVTARNAAGESVPLLLAIRYQTPTPGAPRQRVLHLIAVGVSTYADPQIQEQSPLRYSARDAQQIVAFYKTQQGKLFDRVAAQLLVNQDATRDKIEAALTRIERDAQPGDMVALFVSGHGFHLGESYYFAPSDVILSDIQRTGLRWADLMDRLARLKCEDVILLLDHCYSGGIGRELYQKERGFDARNDEARVLSEANLFTLTSCLPSQECYEHASWNNGAFTYALLEALNGKATPNPDSGNALTLDRVRDYVARRVPQLVKAQGFPLQQPRLFYPTNVGDDVLATIRLARVP